METGKDSDTHENVKRWHYFIDDILFCEYGEETATPYRVTVNIKERPDGYFIYSFSAEKTEEGYSTRRTLHADVNQTGETSKANATTFVPTVPQPTQPVNGNNSQNNQENDLSFLLDNESERFEPEVNKGKQAEQLNIDNAENTPYNKENGGAENGSTGQLHGTAGTGVRTGRNGNETGQDLEIRRRYGRGDLPSTGIVLLSPKSQQLLTKNGIVNIELHESSNDNAVFCFALQQARDTDLQNGWAVTPKDIAELDESGTRTFLSSNGNTGFAIAPDGDIQAVFANKTLGAPKGTTKSIIPQAIANGGTKPDCYGVGLVKLYARYGFVPVARTKFNPEYANPGWTSDKGMPDIYFMMHNGDSADTVVENMGNYKQWSLDELNALPEMEYDDAYSYRDNLLEQALREDYGPVEGKNRRGHGLNPNDIISIIEKLDSPEHLFVQPSNNRGVAVVNHETSGSETVVIVEFDCNINPAYLNGYEGGSYNLAISPFNIDGGMVGLFEHARKNHWVEVFNKAKEGDPAKKFPATRPFAVEQDSLVEMLPSGASPVKEQYSLSDSENAYWHNHGLSPLNRFKFTEQTDSVGRLPETAVGATRYDSNSWSTFQNEAEGGYHPEGANAARPTDEVLIRPNPAQSCRVFYVTPRCGVRRYIGEHNIHDPSW